MKDRYTAKNFLIRNTVSEMQELQYGNYTFFLESIRGNKIFQEQLFVASKILYESLQKYYNNKLKSKKKINQLSKSVYKYFKRSIERSTPFGLFSETSIGSFSSREEVNLNAETHKKVFVDFEWLILLIFKIEKEYSKKLAYKVNKASYRVGDRIVQLYSINDTKTEEMSIKFTKVYQIIEELCTSKYISFDEIITKLVHLYGEEYREIAISYTTNLIENHFLISNLNTELILDFKLEKFISEVKKIDSRNVYHSKLTKIGKLINDYSMLEIGDGIEKLYEIYKYMSLLVETSNYLQIDLYNNGQLYLENEIKDQIVKFAEFLVDNSLAIKRTYLDDYKEKFLEKYGVHREVQLVELFDSNLGIGAPYGYLHPRNDFWEIAPSTIYFNDEEELNYLNMLEKALAAGGNIQLYDIYSETDTVHETGGRNNLGFELFFNINKIGSENILSLTNIGCSKNLGASSGRFSVLSDKLEKYHRDLTEIVEKTNQKLGYNSCEITFLPDNLRHANVMRTTNVRKKTLSLFTDTDFESQELVDIYIGIDSDNNFYARNLQTKEILKFYCTNMYNQMMIGNELRFLCEISSEDHFGLFPWEIIYQKFPHIPRIVFQDIIIAPERWKLSGKMLTKDIHRIIIENNLPQKFYIDSNDNRILINSSNDLDNELFEDILRKTVNKNEELCLSEFVADVHLVKRETKTYATDIVVPIYKKEEFGESKCVPVKSSEVISTEVRQRIPFDEWIYFKLYMSADRQEEFLSDVMPRVLNLVHEDNGIGFYIRYTDPKFHIRLRIKTQKLYNTFEKIQELFQVCLKNKLISSIDISTYDREIERYGGVARISLVEEIFCLDTEIIIKSLNLVHQKILDLTIDDLALLLNYYYLKSFFKGNNKKIILFLEGACPEHIDSQNRDKSRNISIIDLYISQEYLVEFLPELSKLKSRLDELTNSCIGLSEEYVHIIYDSIIHVHNNRLFGIKRERETQIYAVIRGLVVSENFRNGENDE